MYFSVYIKDEVARKLQEIADKEGVSRNNLITKAVEKLINERETDTWGDEVLNWQGCSEFDFGDRNDLTAPA
ncbi:MAG: ribbon-helix-helix domain-containing protein [Cyanobacteria bacterium J06631_6]